MSLLDNLLTSIPEQLPNELFQTIHTGKNVRIERILSKGHATPVNQWYDQECDEWILLVQGQAKLSYKDRDSIFDLKAGDYLLIPARTLHRVEWTPADMITIWLAVHME